MNDPDKAFFNFQKLQLKWKGLTEADTRSKIIDPIFKDCLDWSESNISREEHVHKGFIDYVFKIGGIPKFVLEAKKVGVSFKIPLSFKSRKYRLDGPIGRSGTLIEAIEQVRRYCTEIGANYGIVSNGDQFIIFETFITGKEWRKRECIIYNSLKDIEDNFIDFWDLLSRNAVRLNSLRKHVSGELGGTYYYRPLDKVHNKDEKLVRNHLADVMMPFIGFIFEEITDDSQIDILKTAMSIIRRISQQMTKSGRFSLTAFLLNQKGTT